MKEHAKMLSRRQFLTSTASDLGLTAPALLLRDDGLFGQVVEKLLA